MWNPAFSSRFSRHRPTLKREDRGLDPERMTPLEALQTLHALKEVVLLADKGTPGVTGRKNCPAGEKVGPAPPRFVSYFAASLHYGGSSRGSMAGC